MKAIPRPALSSILVTFFFLVLLFLGLFAEVFESRSTQLDLAQVYANPIPVNELQHLRSIKLTNKSGEFVLENTHPEGNLEGPWQMASPEPMKVKASVVPRILEALNLVKVRNFHALEPINITSFSLDNPTVTLLFTNFKNEPFEVNIGLINPIDNSAYLSLSTQNQIFQIEPIKLALESFDLVKLVDSKVLALGVDSLTSLEILKDEKLQTKVVKKDAQWLDGAGASLSGEKVRALFERLENIKSSHILEAATPEQQAFMERVLVKPTYRLKLVSTLGVRNYLLSEVTEPVPGLSLSLEDAAWALSSEDKKSYVLLGRGQIRNFETTTAQLK